MSRRKLAFLLMSFFVVATAVALWRMRDASPTAPLRFRVAERLNTPAGGVVSNGMDLAARAEQRWHAAEIRAAWNGARSGQSATWRSPRLELPDDFHAVVVTGALEAEASDRAAPLLLWSDTPTLDGVQLKRNRRELPASRRSDATLVPAEALQSDERRPVRYLFLHLPDGGDVEGVIETVAIITARDIAASGVGMTRIAADGQTREAITTRRALTYRINAPPQAELAFAVRVAPVAAGDVAIEVRQSVDNREFVLTHAAARAGEWTEFRVPLRAGSGSSLALSATQSANPALASWSVPQVLVPDDSRDLPNIVLYVVDALRADKLGAYGANLGVSPFLDGLAARGLVFRRAYAAASWTKPSIATLLTSTYPWTHALGARHYTDMLPPGVPMLQTALAANGYATAQFSPNPFTGPVSGLDRDFDAAFLTSALGHRRAFDVKASDVNGGFLRWLAGRPRDRFFAYVHIVDTHPPFSAAAGTPPPKAYEQAISSVDRELARLYSRLEEMQLADNTLFIVTADHGEAFGEHSQSGHGQSVYDEETRVPLVMHWPKRRNAGLVEEAVHSVDVAPTILGYAGVPFAGSPFQGRNVMAITDGTRVTSPVVVTRFTYPEDLDVPGDRRDMYALVDYPWKLILTVAADGVRTRELYHLDRDAGERHNLTAAEAARAGRLEVALETFLRDQARARATFVATYRAGGPRRAAPARDLIDQLRSLGYVR